MAEITTSTPAAGTPMGGQSVTIAGSGFGAAQGAGTVTLEGRACTVVSWTDTQIVITTPRRADAKKRIVYGGGTVSLVVTPATGAADSVGYTYLATIQERAMIAVRASLASLSVNGGAFFDWSAAQVLTVKHDQISIDSGAKFPQAIVYGTTSTARPELSSALFLTIDLEVILQALAPLGIMDDEDYYLTQLIADLHRALMLDPSQGGTALETQMTSFSKDRIDTPTDGAMGLVTLTGLVQIQINYRDFNDNHGYTFP